MKNNKLLGTNYYNYKYNDNTHIEYKILIETPVKEAWRKKKNDYYNIPSIPNKNHKLLDTTNNYQQKDVIFPWKKVVINSDLS